jgi:hypothetical protein
MKGKSEVYGEWIWSKYIIYVWKEQDETPVTTVKKKDGNYEGEMKNSNKFYQSSLNACIELSQWHPLGTINKCQ